MRNLLIVLVLGLGFGACNRDKVVYQEVQEIRNGAWGYDEPYEFRFDVSDTSETYRLLLFVEFNTDYSWQNLYTSISTSFPNDSVQTDVVSLELASKAGAWHGDCNREVCELNIPLQETVRFPEPGSYALAFEQHMREEYVRGIRSIGLKLVVPASDQ